MKYVAIVSAYKEPKVVADTIDSVKTWISKDILLTIDKKGFVNFANYVDPSITIFTAENGQSRGSYRNFLLSILKAVELWKDADWYCFIEWDCLIASDRFKIQLENTTAMCLGFNYRREGDLNLPYLNNIAKEVVKESHYFIGCCLFFSKSFIEYLMKDNFIQRLLDETEELKQGQFPDFRGYSFEEQLFPSLAVHFGGTVQNMGQFPDYPVRWCPDISAEEVSLSPIIFHPLKNINNPIRTHYKKIREALSNL